MSSKIKHIAVMRLSAMGDVAMAVPVLRAFSEQFPEVKITVISRPFFKPFFEEIPNVRFFAFDEKLRHKGFLGLFRLFQDLKQLKIDAFADLHNVLRSKVVRTLFALSGKKIAFLNKARAEKKALIQPKNKIFKQLPTMLQRHAKVFETLGFSIDLSHPNFPQKQKLDSEVLSITGAKNKKWVGIAPFGQHEAKIYPQDLMQKVIDGLAQNPDCMIFLFGAKNEIETLDSFSKNKENVVVIAGKISFQQELQLIGNLDVMLSMDSGNAHIAAMFGIHVITIWGVTHPFAGFMPFNQPFENALLADREKFPKIPTSVYGNKKVEGYENAIRTVLPETVVEKVNSFL